MNSAESRVEFLFQLSAVPRPTLAEFASESRKLWGEARRHRDAYAARPEPAALQALMRILHTIKAWASEMRLPQLEKLAHELEGELGRGALPARLAEVDACIADLQRFAEASARGENPALPTEGASVQVTVEALERLWSLTKEPAARAALEGLFTVPAGTLFARLERSALELAPEAPAPVEVVRTGDTVRMDTRLVGSLHGALIHAIRNAIDHSCEPREERARAGKSETFHIHLRAMIQGEQLVIEVSDDGRGIDIEKVRSRVRERGLAAADKVSALTPNQLFQYLFLPGFSTRDKVTRTSGRGVGLNHLQEVVESVLSGQVELSSEPGLGTRLRIRIPVRACFQKQH